MSDELEALRRELEAERAARKEAETLLDVKSRELYDASIELYDASESNKRMVEQLVVERRLALARPVRWCLSCRGRWSGRTG